LTVFELIFDANYTNFWPIVTENNTKNPILQPVFFESLDGWMDAIRVAVTFATPELHICE
jgi:hypothetical protein